MNRPGVFFYLAATLLAWTPARGAELAIELSVPASRVLVQPDLQIPVSITIRDPQGRGMAGLQPALAASTGTLKNLKDLGGGSYQATYTAAALRHPHAVILAAKVPNAPPGWLVLLLGSKTELPVKTEKPDVLVTLTLGERSYGPLRTDEWGNVKMPLVVWPGESMARAVAEDEFGNRSARRVAIPMPPFARSVGFAEKTLLVADGKDSADLYFIVVAPSGGPEPRARFQTRYQEGDLSPAAQLSPGLYRFGFRAPRELDASETRLVIAAEPNPDYNRHTFVFQFSAGKPERLQASVLPAALPADGRSTARLLLEVADRAGNPLDGLSISAACSPGAVSKVRGLGAGKYRAIYTAAVGAGGTASCSLQVDRGEPQPLRREISIALIPPLPDKIILQADLLRLPLDGKSTAAIDIQLADRDGHPLDGVRLEASAPRGSLGRIVEEGRGRYRTIYTAPAGGESTRVRVMVQAGEGDQRIFADVVIALEAPTPPPTPVPTLSIAPWAGMVASLSGIHHAAFSLEAALKLPLGRDRWYLALEGGYRFGRRERPAGQSGVLQGIDLEHHPLLLAVVFKPLPRGRFTPCLGLGGGLLFSGWRLEPTQGDALRDQRVLPSMFASAGAEARLGPGAAFLTVRYLYAYMSAAGKTYRFDSGEFDEVVFRGNLGGLELGLGYRLFF